MPRPPLILASASPRRADLLRALGLRPTIVAPEIEEEQREGEPPAERALRLAQSKARSVVSRIEAGASPGTMVLAADTVVALDGAILGKPSDEQDAGRMLRFLAGRTHEVFTGVFLLRTDVARHSGLVERTRVRFRGYNDRTVRWYVSTGEPEDKAGAYSVQGLGVLLCEGIEGSWSNVVGLPLERLAGLFRAVGVDFLDLVSPPPRT